MSVGRRIVLLIAIGILASAMDVASATARIASVPVHPQHGSGLLVFLEGTEGSYYSSPGTVVVRNEAGQAVAASETSRDQWSLILAKPGTYTVSATATRVPSGEAPAARLACETSTATVRTHRQIEVVMICFPPVYHSHPAHVPRPSSPAPPGAGRLQVTRAQVPSCSPTPPLHLAAEEQPGANELAGGFYGVGGRPARHGTCTREEAAIAGANTVTVSNAETGVVVASRTVNARERYAIPLAPGTYMVQASICERGAPVTFTMRPGETELMDFVCPIS
jgi:hypothetical protein